MRDIYADVGVTMGRNSIAIRLSERRDGGAFLSSCSPPVAKLTLAASGNARDTIPREASIGAGRADQMVEFFTKLSCASRVHHA
jgi:hypothetical protein